MNFDELRQKYPHQVDLINQLETKLTETRSKDPEKHKRLLKLKGLMRFNNPRPNALWRAVRDELRDD